MNERFLLCYDIANPKRLQRFQRQIRKQAWMLQYSVYLGRLPKAELDRLINRLPTLISPSDDVRLYRISAQQSLHWWGDWLFPHGVKWHDSPDLISMMQGSKEYH